MTKISRFTKKAVRLAKNAVGGRGEVALDGRRVEGDAALSAKCTREQLQEEIQNILDEATEIDADEDEEYGPENRGDELPEELREHEDRLERLREARNQLDAKEQRLRDEQAETICEREQNEAEMGHKIRGRKPTPPEEVELPEDSTANTTDPESQTLKTHSGRVQGYNGQAMVDCKTQVIVAQAITTDANDKQQLEPMLECCNAVNGESPEKVLADAGYWSTANAQLGDDQTELFIATTKDQKRRKELREKDPPRGRIPEAWAERTHGTDVANQARAADLSQTKYVGRTCVWSTRQPRLR